MILKADKTTNMGGVAVNEYLLTKHNPNHIDMPTASMKGSLIYRSFMEGLTPYKISNMLMKKGIPSPTGKKKWYSATIERMLTNEKYKGSALLQKKFTVDFLTKKPKKNEGEVPQYYVENSHPAIISPEDFEQVQAEIERRRGIGKNYSSCNVFSAKVKCGCCGSYFGSKVWHSTDKYRKVIWRCNNKYSGDERCSTPHVEEDALKDKFIDAYNSISGHREEFLESCKQIRDMLTDESELDIKLKTLYTELNDLEHSMQAFIKDNAMKPQVKNFYERKLDEYDVNRMILENDIKSVERKKKKRHSRRELLDTMIRQFENTETIITEFDEKLCRLMVESITVNEDGSMIFEFCNGETVEC